MSSSDESLLTDSSEVEISSFSEDVVEIIGSSSEDDTTQNVQKVANKQKSSANISSIQDTLIYELNNQDAIKPFVSGLSNLPCLGGLKVKGYGVVGLPVNEKAVDSLRPHFSQAPFGKGYKTVLDKKVRNCLEIEKGKFNFTNAEWEENLQALTSKAARELGVNDPVKSIPYKLLLYEKGSFFLPHQDTEKENGMFATLIIQLPSVYEGGELVMITPDNKKGTVCDLGQNRDADTKVYYTMHYADIKHELKPVTAGVRMAVAYSVCFATNMKGRKVPKYDDSTGEDPLQKILQKIDRNSPVILLPLVHEYTKNSMMWKSWKPEKKSKKMKDSDVDPKAAELEGNGFDALKGKDRAFVERLKYLRESLTGEKNFDLLLMLYKKTVEEGGYDQYSDMEEMDVNEKNTFFDCEGDELDISLQVNVPAVDLGKGTVTNEESYTGNAGASRTTEYLKTFIVIIPEVGDNIAAKMKIYGVIKTIADLKRSIKSNPKAQHAKQAKQVMENVQNWTKQSCALFVDLLLPIKNVDLAREFFESTKIENEDWVKILDAEFIDLLNADKSPKIQVKIKALISQRDRYGHNCAQSRLAFLNRILPANFETLSKKTTKFKLCSEWIKTALQATESEYLAQPVEYRWGSFNNKAKKEFNVEEGIFIENVMKLAAPIGLDLSSFMKAFWSHIPYSEFKYILQYLKAKQFKLMDLAIQLSLDCMVQILQRTLSGKVSRHSWYEGTNGVENAHHIFETAILYNSCDCLDSFATLLSHCHSKPDAFDNVINSFLQYKNSIPENEAVAKILLVLIKHYKQQLSQSQPVPDTCWQMKHAKLDHPDPEIEAFLKGDAKQLTISGRWHSIAHARRYKINGVNFSVDYNALGAGARAFVIVSKTRNIFFTNKGKLAEATKALANLDKIVSSVPFFQKFVAENVAKSNEANNVESEKPKNTDSGKQLVLPLKDTKKIAAEINKKPVVKKVAPSLKRAFLSPKKPPAKKPKYDVIDIL